MPWADPDWAHDPKFATHENRKQNEDDLDANISAWTADKDAYELMRLLQSKGVPAGVVQGARELLDEDEHMRERGYYVYLDHPETGRAAYDGPPVRALRRRPAACAHRPRSSASTRSTSAKRSSASPTKTSRS